MTPFEIFGIPPTFDVDLTALEQRYRDLSRAVHPDRFTQSGARERRASLSKALDVNAAWRALRDPITRADALLATGGWADPTRDGGPAVEPKASPALLMEVLELREELADARASRDRAKVAALAAAVREREAGVLASLSAGFRGEAEASSVRALVAELRYVRRFLDEVRAIEEDLE